MIEIPIPIDPSEQDQPRSWIQIPLSNGVFQINGIPLFGPKTIQNFIDTLEIWKPILVKPELSLAIYNPEFRWSQMLSRFQ